MATTTISGLPAGVTPTGTEVGPFDQAATTVKLTVAQINAAPLAAVAALASTVAASYGLAPSGDATGAQDVANLQAIFNKIAAGTVDSGSKISLAPSAPYYFNAAATFTYPTSNVLNQNPLIIDGQGATINQLGTNVGIMEFDLPAAVTAQDLQIRNIVYNYTVAQGTTSVKSTPIVIKAVATGTGQSLTGVTVEDCQFIGCYRAIANGTTAGSISINDVTANRNLYEVCSDSPIYLVNPVSAQSSGFSTRDCTWSSPSSPGDITGAGTPRPMIMIDGYDSVVVETAGFSGVLNQPLMQASNCTAVNVVSATANNCNWAHWSGSGGGLGNILFRFINSYGRVGPISLKNTTIHGTGGTAPCLFSVEGSTGAMQFDAPAIQITSNSPENAGTLTLFNTTAVRCTLAGGVNVLALPGGSAVRLTDSTTTSSSFVTTGAKSTLSADQGDASFTLGTNYATATLNGVWATPETLLFNTPLTAVRTVSLSAVAGTAVADNLPDGYALNIVRTANCTGAALNITGLVIPATSLQLSAAGTKAAFKWSRVNGWTLV